MKCWLARFRCRIGKALAAGLFLALCALNATGQLAITEVMSEALNSRAAPGSGPGSDFFELTNFGPEPIELAGYTYTDKDNIPRADLVDPSGSLLIGTNESVIFVRLKETATEAQFRNWWGACLPPNVQVRMISGSPGLNADLDGIRLYDWAGNLVDRVDFRVARKGVTFVYDTNTGELNTFSVLETCGTCRAAATNDIGSPGVTCGPVPLRILTQPTDQAVCAGTDAMFSVRAAGLPRPKFQWLFNGAAITGANAASLTITNAGPSAAGQYRVVVSNGLTATQSTNVILTVSTNPSPPIIVTPPAAMLCYTGQTARFAVTVCAYPLPTHQWLSNGVPIPGATERTLRVSDATFAMSGVDYCVRIQNTLGTSTACARLTVTTKPELKITEIMPAADPGCPTHEDWFELTNQGTNAMNLLGCRFSDRLSFEAAVTITQAILVQPGESIIFVARMTPGEFTRWWGADSLPPGLKIFTYVGFGIAQTPIDGDEGLYVWNAAAEAPNDSIDFKTYSSAQWGISIVYDCVFNPNPFECLFGKDSEAAQGGAFRAAECSDIGSPGYTTNPPPRLVSITRAPSVVTLRWRAVEGRTYRLSYKASLGDAIWRELSRHTATNSVQAATDRTAGGAGQRFYIVEELQ